MSNDRSAVAPFQVRTETKPHPRPGVMSTTVVSIYDGELFFYLTSVAISLMTLLLAGIPAALYERVRGLQQSTPGSLAIWLLATALLTLPAILRALALSED